MTKQNQGNDTSGSNILGNDQSNSNPELQPALEKVETMVGMVSDVQTSFSKDPDANRQELLDAIQRLQTMVDELSAHFATRH
jgi:hypothetical protein